MRLSQLLKYKQDLQSHSSTKLEYSANDHIALVNQLGMGSDRISEAGLIQEINSNYRNIFPLLRQIEDIKNRRIAELDKDILELDKKYFIDSYDMYETQHKIADVATNRDIRRLYIYENVKDIIKSRIYHYVNWKYPSLEIGPGDGTFTKEMVASDPLYIVDVHQEFLDNTKLQFNEFYATRRLRSYLIKNDYNLDMLPQHQMAFVLAWNVFNYFPLEAIKSYLTEIVKVMRPGGVLMFSYNNSDRWQNAEMVENAFMCHTPKHMLLPLIESLGFEIITSYDFDPTVSWVEVRKPGELSTCKAHQALGAIIQVLDEDEDPRSLKARVDHELKSTLDAQQRFELQKNRPDLFEKAKALRDKYNLTIEKAMERVMREDETIGALRDEWITNKEKNKQEKFKYRAEIVESEERKLKAISERDLREKTKKIFDVIQLAQSYQIKYHTYSKEQCIKKALEQSGYTDLTIDDIDY